MVGTRNDEIEAILFLSLLPELAAPRFRKVALENLIHNSTLLLFYSYPNFYISTL